MFKYFHSIVFIAVLSSAGILAQAPTEIKDSLQAARFKTMEDTLTILSYAMVHDSTPIKRYASCRKFIKNLVQTLKIENSFAYPFERLRTVSILYPPDSSFRIFTWQVYVDINEYHYYGAIQMNSAELKLYPLVDRSEEVEHPETAILKADKWYGALYYNILPFETEAGVKYLLFGYDAYRFFNKRKFIDVLQFEAGKPVFGDAVFVKENKDTVSRFILTYNADASIRLNYNEVRDMIILDHLIEMGSPYPNQGLTYVPDGDTDGMVLRDGMWLYKPRVLNEVLDEAPRPVPVLEEGSQKDIFGQEDKQ